MKGVRRNMGVLQYYFLPCFRSWFSNPEPPLPPKPAVDMEALKKRRLEEYKELKNPETAAHVEFKMVLEANPDRILTKLNAGEKNRRNRAEDREMRRLKRKENPHLHSAI